MYHCNLFNLEISAQLPHIPTEEDVANIHRWLHEQLHVTTASAYVRYSFGTVSAADLDTPDTSSFTEVGYPQPEASAEEPAPVEEAAPAGVTKDDVKAILREFRDRFGTDALRELYRLVAEGKTKLVDLSEDEYPIIYKAAKEKLNAK